MLILEVTSENVAQIHGWYNYGGYRIRYIFAYNFYKQHLLHGKFHRRNEKNRGFHIITTFNINSNNCISLKSDHFWIKCFLPPSHWATYIQTYSPLKWEVKTKLVHFLPFRTVWMHDWMLSSMEYCMNTANWTTAFVTSLF